MRVIAYARFSTEHQSERSIQDQLRVCRDYAHGQGWTVAAEYSDEGISGAALGNRPGVRAALAALDGGGVLLINDLSRLSRSQDLAPLITRLRHRGVRVIGVQDGYDSDSRTARMQAGLSGIMSEEFRAMIGDRTRSALEMRAREGRPTGGKAYSDPLIVPEIFARFAAGESLKAIASDLNRRGIPSPGANWKARNGTRGRWLVSALHALLRNELYVGRKVWNRSRWVKDPDTGKRLRRERPESEWVITTCQPMIDAATWSKVQARLSHRRTGKGGKPRYLLSGLLECALCGSRLIVVGGSQRRYVCGQHHAGGPHACANSTGIPRLVAEEYILAPVVDDLLSPAAIAEGVRLLREARTAAERPTVNREVAELERLVREGLVSAELIAPSLAAARRRAAVERNAETLPWPSESAWRAAVAAMKDILAGDDVSAAREALRELIGPIRCTPDGVHVIAEMQTRQVWLMTGTGVGIRDGSGGRI